MPNESNRGHWNADLTDTEIDDMFKNPDVAEASERVPTQAELEAFDAEFFAPGCESQAQSRSILEAGHELVSKHGPVIPGIPVPSQEAIAELRELFAAGPYTGHVPEGARAVVAPKATVTREYVCREFELGPARDGHVYVHREIGVRSVPDAKHPREWCDHRIAECWSTEEMNRITLALNFAHQQGVI